MADLIHVGYSFKDKITISGGYATKTYTFPKPFSKDTYNILAVVQGYFPGKVVASYNIFSNTNALAKTFPVCFTSNSLHPRRDLSSITLTSVAINFASDTSGTIEVFVSVGSDYPVL